MVKMIFNPKMIARAKIKTQKFLQTSTIYFCFKIKFIVIIISIYALDLRNNIESIAPTCFQGFQNIAKIAKQTKALQSFFSRGHTTE